MAALKLSIRLPQTADKDIKQMWGYAFGVVRETKTPYREVTLTKHTLKITSLIVISTLLLSACGVSAALQETIKNNSAGLLDKSSAQAENTPAAADQTSDASGLLAAYEGTLGSIYEQVYPSVVNIRVVQEPSSSSLDQSQSPFDFNLPEGSLPEVPQYSQGLGSGFMWDSEGHIVTNNHVVDGADRIEVTLADGTTLPAELVGADPYSDLAVIKVEGAPDLLHPVQMADSEQVKVGELAIAIGNPFGLENTMTVGIISALGRSLPSSEGYSLGPVYSIPNIIQTDAPINPGNSGGVLLNDQGQVIGVTAAIESPIPANAGIGFAIPSAIVNKVVPSLIETGTYDHPYLASAAPTYIRCSSGNEPSFGAGAGSDGHRDGPAASRFTSQDTTTIDGQEVPTGGDVITAINNQTITRMDDLIAYLNDETEVGQTVKLTILREGEETTVDVTLDARPAYTSAIEAVQNMPESNLPDSETQSNAWLGILGAELTPEIAKAMNLNEDQQGILVVQVESDSPAELAKLHGSDQEVTIEGQTVTIGGDVITAVDGKAVATLDDAQPGPHLPAQHGSQPYHLQDGKTLSTMRWLNGSNILSTIGRMGPNCEDKS
jgi:S1-C subfamily serine protease